jgi:probable F420-dependent oxidoreductase
MGPNGNVSKSSEAPSTERSPARLLVRRIGPVGVWTFQVGRLAATEARAFVREVEALGFPALWFPETLNSKEALSQAALLLSFGERITVATGIANIWARDPLAMANGARTLAEAYPGRFVLGIGVSHAPSARMRGRVYERPFATMVEYLDRMDAAPYAGPPLHEPVPWVLAALGPRMLRLAAERTLGAHPYFVPVEHTAQARQVLGPDPLLAVEQAVVLETDPERARQVAREHMRRYLELENYTNNLRRLGWSDADLARGGSDRVVDAIVAWGDVEAVRRRIETHIKAGADHVCVQPLEEGAALNTLGQLRALAPVLLDVGGTRGRG